MLRARLTPIVRRTRPSRASALLFALLLAGLLLPANASAHGELLSSDPAPNATLAAAPKQITLTFSEPIDGPSATVSLLTAQGVVVPGVGPVSVRNAGTRAVVALPDLPAGVYTVSYQVTSATDGHVTSGIFAFLVDPTGTQAPPLARTSSSSLSSGLDVVLARWLALAALLALVGTIIFWLLSARPALTAAGIAEVPAPWGPISLAAAASLIGLLVYLSLAARPILASSGGDAAVHGGWFPLDFAGPFGWTPFANAMRVALLGTFASFVLAVSRWIAHDEARRSGASAPLSADRGWLAVLFGAGVLATAGLAFAGHPAAEGGTLLALMDLVHLLGAAAWLGTLVGLFLLVRRARRAVGEALRRHSRLALIAAPVVVLSGLANSPILVGNTRELVGSGYGNTLLSKALLFSVAVGIGAVNHLLVKAGSGRRALPLVGGELIVGALAVLAASNLTTGQPSANRPDELALPALTTAHLYGQAGQSAVHVAVDLPAPGNQRYQVGVADAKTNAPRTDVQNVFLDFTPPPGSGLASKRVRMNASDDPAFWGLTGAYTPVVGEWHLEVIMRRVGLRDETVEFPVSVTQPEPPEAVPPHDIGIGVPLPLALAWRWLPAGIGGWLVVLVALAIAAGVAVARTRVSRPLALIQAGVVIVAIVIGLVVGSRAVVQVANAAPASAEAAQNPTTANAESISRGEDLYGANCAACHGADGAGDGPTALDKGLVIRPLSESLANLSDGAVEYRITVGTVGSGMPGFAGTLSTAERWDLVNYLRARIAR